MFLVALSNLHEEQVRDAGSITNLTVTVDLRLNIPRKPSILPAVGFLG